MKKQEGYFDIDALLSVLLVLLLPAIILVLCFSKSEFSNQRVSGIAYNVQNDTFPVGNTNFSIRASEDTYVSEENKSSYCLPSDSPYIELVNQAAENKDIKLIVKTEKGFWFKMPWSCVDNVTVEKLEK